MHEPATSPVDRQEVQQALEAAAPPRRRQALSALFAPAADATPERPPTAVPLEVELDALRAELDAERERTQQMTDLLLAVANADWLSRRRLLRALRDGRVPPT